MPDIIHEDGTTAIRIYKDKADLLSRRFFPTLDANININNPKFDERSFI